MTPTVSTLLVAALGLGILTGCTAEEAPTPDPSPSDPPNPDAEYLRLAVQRKRFLMSMYDDPAPVAPELSALLAEMRVHHEEHIRALVDAAHSAGVPLPPTQSPSAGPTAVSPGATPPMRGPQAVPAKDAVDLARRIVAAERNSSEIGLAALPAIRSPDLALLGAQVSASEAQHATALFTALREGLVRRVTHPTPTTVPTPS